VQVFLKKLFPNFIEIKVEAILLVNYIEQAWLDGGGLLATLPLS